MRATILTYGDGVARWAYDEDKLAELIVYCAKALEDDPLAGATKLNKVAYFADFSHLRRTGSPITGAEYQKLPNGPAPRRLLPVLRRLQAAAVVEIKQFVDRFGYRQERVCPLASSPPQLLDAAELETIDGVIEELRPMNGSQVSLLSHQDLGWKLVDFGETIPYETAYLSLDAAVPDQLADSVRRRSEELIEEFGDQIADRATS